MGGQARYMTARLGPHVATCRVGTRHIVPGRPYVPGAPSWRGRKGTVDRVSGQAFVCFVLTLNLFIWLHWVLVAAHKIFSF